VTKSFFTNAEITLSERLRSSNCQPTKNYAARRVLPNEQRENCKRKSIKLSTKILPIEFLKKLKQASNMLERVL